MPGNLVCPGPQNSLKGPGPQPGYKEKTVNRPKAEFHI